MHGFYSHLHINCVECHFVWRAVTISKYLIELGVNCLLCGDILWPEKKQPVAREYRNVHVLIFFITPYFYFVAVTIDAICQFDPLANGPRFLTGAGGSISDSLSSTNDNTALFLAFFSIWIDAFKESIPISIAAIIAGLPYSYISDRSAFKASSFGSIIFFGN